MVQLMLALTLAETPEEASKNCRWGWRFIWRDDQMAAAACADLLIARGRSWAADFTEVATAATFRGESRRGVGEVTALVSPAVDAFDLPVPLTETYVLGWAGLLSWAHTYAAAENRGQWYPLTLLRSTPDGARPAYHLSESTTLSDCLDATPHLTELLCAAVDLPDALKDWAAFKGPNWDIHGTVRDVVAAGRLHRSRVLDRTLHALARDDRPHSQRALAQVLTGLDASATETKDRVPLLLNVIATAHGVVTGPLLELVLAADIDDADLVEFGTVILARPEKAQKQRLLAHLGKSTTGARQALLLMAAESEDAAFAAKAMAILGQDDETVASDVAVRGTQHGLPAWSHRVEPFAPGRWEPYPADESGLDRAASEAETWSRITTEAAYLDLVVRFGHRSLTRLRAAVGALPTPGWYSHVRTPFLVHHWVTTGDANRSYRRTGTSITFEAGVQKVEQHVHELRPPEHLAFTDRLVEETLPRLGSLRELLSTPSHADGTLAVRDLAQRVRRARNAGYGPYDLVQALLRLEPTSPADVEHFSGLTLPPAADAPETGSGGRTWFRGRRAKAGDADGVEAIRHWITAGGWTVRTVDFPDLEPRAAALVLPLRGEFAHLEGLAVAASAIGTGQDPRRSWGSNEPGPYLGVLPRDVEGLATVIAQGGDLDSVFYAQGLPLFTWSAGLFGPAVHHHLARLLAHPRLDSRLLAAQAGAEIARQGRLDPNLLRDRSLALFNAGKLPLSRAAHGWSQVASQASLAVVWPAWLAVLDAACAAPRKPAGLADLLRATRDVVLVTDQHDPNAALPASVSSLAAQRGSTKAVTEAQALIRATGGATTK